MAGANSNRDIVFVFNHTGDAAGRKKNLSAINTQVAYRAHERRREKKNRQRAQTNSKDDVKVDQPSSSPDVCILTTTSSTSTTTKYPPTTKDARHDAALVPAANRHSGLNINRNVEVPAQRSKAEARRHLSSTQPKRAQIANSSRRDSDQDSDLSSDHSAVWSVSPVSSRYSSPATDLTAISPATNSQINGYFDSALDPFFRLPTVASDREKWLVQFYFKEMGHLGFGTHQNSLFCPDRDWVSKYVSSKSLCFQWVLILAEEHLGRMGVFIDQNRTIGRKAKAYSSLNSMLTSTSINLDERLSGIMFAAIVDAAQSNLHLAALDRLINDTGGLDAFMDGPLGITHPEHITSAYAFGACPIIDAQALHKIKERFLGNLRLLHTDAKLEKEEKLRLQNRRPWDRLGQQMMDSNGCLIRSNNDEHLRYYIRSQQDVVNTDCLAQLLDSALNLETDYSSQARHVACLLQVLMIMHEFGDNYFARATFLKRLQYMAQRSTARNPVTGQAYLSHAGLLLINSCVRQEVQTYVDRTQALKKGIEISKVVIDALKIVPLLSIQSRGLIVSWMRDWLCHNEYLEDADLENLTEQSLTILDMEITRNWRKNSTSG